MFQAPTKHSAHRTPAERPTVQILGASLVAAARRYMGVPFVHQGRTFAGLDCLGLVVVAARECGIVLPDRRDYPRDPVDGELRRVLDATLDPVSRREAGAVALIEWDGEERHVAIFTPDRVIHAWNLPGKVCEHHMNGWFLSKVRALYRVPICPR